MGLPNLAVKPNPSCTSSTTIQTAAPAEPVETNGAMKMEAQNNHHRKKESNGAALVSGAILVPDFYEYEVESHEGWAKISTVAAGYGRATAGSGFPKLSKIAKRKTVFPAVYGTKAVCSGVHLQFGALLDSFSTQRSASMNPFRGLGSKTCPRSPACPDKQTNPAHKMSSAHVLRGW